TLVVRSKGTDASLYLYGDANDYRRNMEPMAFVGSIGGISGVVDPDGPNAQLLVTLPADPDRYYVAVVGPQDQADYSLTVLPGLVPQRELMALPTPIYGNEGQFMSPFTEDNTVTAWVEKGLQAEVASNVGTALGSLAAMSNSDNIMLSRSEEHTSELQSRENLVCRLLLDVRRPPRATRFPYTTLFRSRELMALPTPIYGNEGQFMSPFTEDNTVTAWVEKGLQAEVASNVGTALGSLAAMSNSDNIMLS